MSRYCKKVSKIRKLTKFKNDTLEEGEDISARRREILQAFV